jgi:phage gpG-like protein
MTNEQKITAYFSRFKFIMDKRVPGIIDETAREYYKESFRTKSFDGKSWKPNKRPNKKGSQLVRSGAMMATIRGDTVSPSLVRIKAGNNKVRYARAQNEGAVISRAERSETFVRNRYKNGAKSKYFGGMGAYKKGTTPGRGYTFKKHKIVIPARPFMGHAAELNRRIKNRFKDIFN